jgi:hypothetical protein
MVRAAQWQDLWDVGNGPLPGNTCCVTKLRDTTTGYLATGRRIDRVMHQGVCRADSAQVLLNAPFVTSEGIALFPSDHGMVYGRLIYGVRP